MGGGGSYGLCLSLWVWNVPGQVEEICCMLILSPPGPLYASGTTQMNDEEVALHSQGFAGARNRHTRNHTLRERDCQECCRLRRWEGRRSFTDDARQAERQPSRHCGLNRPRRPAQSRKERGTS